VEQNLTPEIKESLLGRWEPVYRSQLNYSIVWSTRGRKPVLRERHLEALQRLIQATCDDRGFALLECVATSDQVRLLLGLRPTHSVAAAVREIKGRTGMALLAQFPELRVWLRGNLTWDERYSVETVSAGRLERVRDRLRALHVLGEELAAAS
jgi:putative transposase